MVGIGVSFGGVGSAATGDLLLLVLGGGYNLQPTHVSKFETLHFIIG